MNEIRHYNRIMFLLQGLLDRSQVFSPHPPINLMNPEHVEQYFQGIYDEEDGLPSANPPKWEDYRDAANKKIKVGTMVMCFVGGEKYGGYCRDDKRPKYGYDANERPNPCEVSRVSRDRKKVRLSWDLGERLGYEHGSWGKWMKLPYKKKGHQWIEMEKVFNLEAYEVGDYKKFLCDRHLKGKYNQWAAFLLRSEKWYWCKNNPEKKDLTED